MSRRANNQEGEGDVEGEPDRHREKQNGLLSRWVSGESLGKSFLSSLLSRTNVTGNGGVLPREYAGFPLYDKPFVNAEHQTVSKRNHPSGEVQLTHSMS